MGAEKACAIHRQLTRLAIRHLADSGMDWCCYSDQPQHDFFQPLKDSGIECYRQSAGGLGERMLNALDQQLRRAENVLLMGSDCPALDARLLQQAAVSMQTADCVIVPAEDGGYALIGFHQLACRQAFENISWGSAGVYQQTLAKLDALGVNTLTLDSVADIDWPDDYRRWQSTLP